MSTGRPSWCSTASGQPGSRTRAVVHALRARDASARDLHLAAAAEQVAARLQVLEAPLVGDLPRLLVHGDFWDNNVLFQRGEIVAVLDVDFMGERARIDDAALTLYYANSTLGVGYTSAERLTFLSGLVNAYDGSRSNVLSPTARAACRWRWPVPFLPSSATSPGIRDQAARERFLQDTTPDVGWALDIVRNLKRWQRAFA